MSEKDSKPKTVEELKNFPFKDFKEFKKSCFEGVAQAGVDRSIALDWAQNGIYTTRFFRAQILFFVFLPWLVFIGFIVFVVINKIWIWLLGLPVFLLAFFIFHPSSAMIFGPIRTGLIGLTIFGFCYSLWNSNSVLAVFTVGLLIIWYSLKSTYRKAIDKLIAAVNEHEDLLCILWNARGLNIRLYNGDSYWVDWKLEDGKHIHYEK